MKVFCQGPTCNIFRFPHSRLKDKALSPPFDAVSIGLIKKGNIIPDGWRICLIGTELVVCCNDCIKYVKKEVMLNDSMPIIIDSYGDVTGTVVGN